MTTNLNKHARLREAPAGRFQFDNIHLFSWKWMRVNGKFKIENVDSKLKPSNTSMTQFLVKEAVRTLGVCAFPQLQWDEQFKVTKKT